MMNCDQVFDILTRGPFPAGDKDDTIVERHLASCHDCCALAEALRPATDLFHEAMSAEESVGLPGYRGARTTAYDDALPQTIATMLDVAAASERQPQVRRRDAATTRAVGSLPVWAVVGTLLIAAGLFVVGQTNRHGSGTTTPSTDLAALRLTMATNVTEEGMRQLTSLQLPVACVPKLTDGDADPLTQLNAAHHQCCTRCHASGTTTITSDRLVSAMASSCSACHRPQTRQPNSSDVSSLPTHAMHLLCCL